MAQFDITSPGQPPTAAAAATSPMFGGAAPPALSQSAVFTSPLASSSVASPLSNQNSFQSSPFMPASASMNDMDLFTSSSSNKHSPFGGSRTPFGEFGGLNGNSGATNGSGGQFLNNNGLPPVKPLASPLNNGSVTDQFGLL